MSSMDEYYDAEMIDRLTAAACENAELKAERNQLRLALDDALKSFKLTQNPDDYSKDHWSNRAQSALQEDRDE